MVKNIARGVGLLAAVAAFGLLAAGSTDGTSLSGDYVAQSQDAGSHQAVNISGDTVIYVMTSTGGGAVIHNGEISKREKDKETGLVTAFGSCEITVKVSGRSIGESPGSFRLEQRKEGGKTVLDYTYRNKSSSRGEITLTLVKE
jgi:hypothetical protein